MSGAGPKVLVVGAGAIGLFCAWRLARRGAAVTLIESEAEGASPSRSASRAAAGMLGPISETLSELPGTHARLLDLGLASLDLWRAAGPALKLSGFPARGATLLGDDRDRRARLEKLAALCAERGLKTRWRGEDLEVPDEAALDPHEALAALRRALLEAGGGVRAGEAVAATARSVALTDGTRLDADIVLLAPGVWAVPGLIEAAPALGRISAMYGVLVEIAASDPAPGATLRAAGAYAVGRAPGRVVLGSTMWPGRTALDVDSNSANVVQKAMAAAAPRLGGARRLAAWAGVRPMSPDWAPMIGTGGECLVAAGHSRNGWLLAPITAEIISAFVFGDPIGPLWAAFAPDRF